MGRTALACAAVQLLLLLSLLPTTPSASEANDNSTRIFIDEGYFLPGDTEILRAHIAATRGAARVSGESTGAFLSVKGYYVPDRWDVYFTARQACAKALPLTRAGQRVSCVPGAQAVVYKKRLVETMQQAYGELAFTVIPRSYALPEQYWLWRSALLASHSPRDARWVLKADAHRGRGVEVVRQADALRGALRREPGDADGGGGGYHHVLVQRFVERQLHVGGRASYLRVWAVVTSVAPLRAYLFDGGFAVFGAREAEGEGKDAAAASAALASRSGIVNLWTQDRDASPIWSLSRLRRHLDRHHPGVPAAGSGGGGISNRTFEDAWRDVRRGTALALAAALPEMRAAAANGGGGNGSTFEYFGLDFVLDEALVPTLLEVNAVPSMARRRGSGCAGARAAGDCALTAGGDKGDDGGDDAGADFDAQKEWFVGDLLALIGVPTVNGSDGGGGSGGGSASVAALLDAAARELASVKPPTARGRHHYRRRKLLPQAAWRPLRALLREHKRPHAHPPATTPTPSPTPKQQQQPPAVTASALAAAKGPLTQRLRPLLCTTANAADAAQDDAPFACTRCLTAADLATLAAVESELQAAPRRMQPLGDVIAAWQLNRQAAAEASASLSAAEPAASATAPPPESSSGGGGGAAFASDDVGVWRRLHRTWQALAAHGGSAVAGLEVMRFFTTAAALPAPAPLPFVRRDYVVSAWLRARAEVACGGSGGGGKSASDAATNCLVARLHKLVTSCPL